MARRNKQAALPPATPIILVITIFITIFAIKIVIQQLESISFTRIILKILI